MTVTLKRLSLQKVFSCMVLYGFSQNIFPAMFETQRLARCMRSQILNFITNWALLHTIFHLINASFWNCQHRKPIILKYDGCCEYVVTLQLCVVRIFAQSSILVRLMFTYILDVWNSPLIKTYRKWISIPCTDTGNCIVLRRTPSRKQTTC